LFCNAPHPFVQSWYFDIVQADEKTRGELTVQLKNRIDAFEKQKDETDSFFTGFSSGIIMYWLFIGRKQEKYGF